MNSIAGVQARDKLQPRHEPYWVKLSTGCYLGFRKLTTGSTGSWLARFRDDSGRREKRSLGEFGELPPSQRYDAAKRAAEEWFAHLGRGGSSEATNVRQACEAYERHVRATKGERPADDLKMRYKRWIYSDTELAEIDLSRLTRTRLDRWRARMTATPAKINRDKRERPLERVRSPASINRDMTALRAALNYALDAGKVATDAAWRLSLRPAKNAGGRRDFYLDITQRRKLIEHAEPGLALLLRGMSLVPLRPGAVAALTVQSFDTKLGVLTIGKDKAGKDRRIKLPAATAALFAERTEDRKASEPLFTRSDGKPWDKDAWKGPIKDAAAAAELPPSTTAYSIRHSVITDLVTGGLDLLTVAQLSGTSVAMIEKHYGHLRADVAAAALAQLAL